MSRNADTYDDRVVNILREYVQPNRSYLITVERLYQNLTGDEIELTTWEDAFDEFRDIDWDADLFQDFVNQVKEFVEQGETSISETYFDIIEPDSISRSLIEQELSDPEYEPEKSGEERDGFEYRLNESNNLVGKYVYTDVKTNLTMDGEVQPTISDGFIQFEIDPERSLLIVRSTKVTDIQKARKYFDRKTSIEIRPSADLTTHTDGALDRINNFLGEFEQGIPDDGGDGPGLLQVDEIKMEDTSVDGDDEEEDDDNGEQLENIQFEGHDIKNDDEVQSYLGDDSPWVIKKLEAEVYYGGDNFLVTIGTTSMMSYAKVSDSTDLDATQELSGLVREWFMDDLRVSSP